MAISVKQLKKMFVDSGLITGADFIEAQKDARAAGVSLEAALTAQGSLTDEQMGKVIADAYGIQFVNLNRVKIDPKAVAVIPEIVTKKQGIMAYAWSGESLLVVMTDPENVEFLSFLEKKTGYPVSVAYTTPEILSSALSSFDENTVAKITALIEEYNDLIHASKKTLKTMEGEEDVVIRLVDHIMQYGYGNSASDIHIEPQEDKSLMRYRIDGVLHDLMTMPKALYEKVLSRIKILSNLRTDEHFAAQDGKFRFVADGTKVDVRVSILPVVGGEKVVMRLLSDKGRAYTLEHLGFCERDFAQVQGSALKPYGMILVTGPTGSGKTTTLYSILRLLNRREVNIQTIEDPVEYDIEGINQIQVNEKTSLTFSMGLRSIVRQDPDIIMVGEIRDSETAGIAINAAMTGHLVLSTLHTNDSATALPRLLDMGVEPFLVASSVNLIVAQRLVRKICSACITSTKVETSQLKTSIPKDLFAKYFGDQTAVRLYKGKGCPSCNNTGYAGRQGIFEVMEVTDAVKELIINRENASRITKQAQTEGMLLMFEDGIKKALAGSTTIEEVLRVAVS
ncbi:type II/IV secretion system protein [Patescibacteria group bacterium]|nr:type II/IV secretion system protein [Patescibacteria group bacterium]MBU1705304.1 type II/IV secretion system protein [Patescibacteria group bacterium]